MKNYKLLDQEMEYEKKLKNPDFLRITRLVEAGAGGTAFFHMLDAVMNKKDIGKAKELLVADGPGGIDAFARIEFNPTTGLRLCCSLLQMATIHCKKYGLTIRLGLINREGETIFFYPGTGKFSIMKLMSDVCYSHVIEMQVGGASSYDKNRYMLNYFMNTLKYDLRVTSVKFSRKKSQD